MLVFARCVINTQYSIVFAKLCYYNWLLMFTLTTPVGQTSGRCVTQLAKTSIDLKFIELTADVFRSFFRNTSATRLYTCVPLQGYESVTPLWMLPVFTGQFCEGDFGAQSFCVVIFCIFFLNTPAVSWINLGSMHVFASCVIHRPLVFTGVLAFEYIEINEKIHLSCV